MSEQPATLSRKTNRAYNITQAAILLASSVGAVILVSLVYQITRPLPYRFTQDVYMPTPFEVCPGDSITYERATVITGEATALLSGVWLDPRDGKAMEPARLGDAGAFAWRSHDHVASYYEEQGHPIELQTYPLVISRTITATVPLYAVFDSPMVLEVSTIVGTPARYTVPVWVMAAGDCE
jgi:hypothetical protein